ncbi:MAG: hypothetical protein IH891_02360 [Planctomycetes bacterium]|nr:hypothetical protein [Planctomycetota bacterium]
MKYMNLADHALHKWGIGRVVHLILGPSAGRETFRRRDRWLRAVDEGSGRMLIGVDGLREAMRPGKWRDRLSDTAELSRLRAVVDVVPSFSLTYGVLKNLASNCEHGGAAQRQATPGA